MLKHFEYSIQLPAQPSEVFRVLTDTSRWRHSRIYGEIAWQGEPWRIGSTRVIETLVPFHARHRQKVLALRQDELLSVLSHGFGYTNHTQIVLTRMALGGTEARYLIDIEGTLPLLFGFVIEEFVARFMDAYIPELKRLCESDPTPSARMPGGRS
jgi:hypothetical protein